jgi:alkanesulfonate monooxygenase SsuD/methylene tetrahydromethanopterin reductase-like flavin-dependent oxidoreductase (luciferase family)
MPASATHRSPVTQLMTSRNEEATCRIPFVCYDSLWNFDHFYPIFVDPDGPCLEAWTTLSALAQATKRARIGTLVNGNTYRNPCLTAKMVASLDHISGGRLNFGLGAGWFELEHRAMGFDFKDVPRRLAALDEALRIIKGMLREPRTTSTSSAATARRSAAIRTASRRR